MATLPRDETLGAIVALAIYSFCILVFVARLVQRPALGQWFGVGVLACALPLVYLLVRAPQSGRPFLFYVQVGLMLLYVLVEFILDYWLRLDFRHTRWAVVSYVTLFFGATGGMLGVAALAGRSWIISAAALFFIMAMLAFVQRAVTGM